MKGRVFQAKQATPVPAQPAVNLPGDRAAQSGQGDMHDMWHEWEEEQKLLLAQCNLQPIHLVAKVLSGDKVKSRVTCVVCVVCVTCVACV